MYFANPWGLLALFSLPIIALIHIYHRRFPPLEIAGAHLWGAQMEMRSAGRRRDKLPFTATLLLELLAALLLSLALAQPRVGATDQAIHFIVVLDNSASMRAVNSEGNTFREAAIFELKKRVKQHQRNTLMTIILTGPRTVMLAGPAIPWSKAESELENWKPSDTGHSYQSAWDLASQLADSTGRILYVTDQMPDEQANIPKQMEIVSVGEKVDNLAIASARWTFHSSTGKGSIFLLVENYGREMATVQVTGETVNQKGSQVVFKQQLKIPAGKNIPLTTEVAGGLGELKISLASDQDKLDIDSQVTLIEPKVRMLTVAVSLEDQSSQRAIQQGLKAIPDIQLGNAADAHLQVSSAARLPESRDDLWWLGIGPLQTDEPARKAAKNLIAPYLIEKENPLLAGVMLGGVIWGGVQSTELKVAPIISAGKYPLLARLTGTLTTAYMMNIDFAKSNLAESPDWPIMLSNIVEERRKNLPGLRRWNYRINEPVQFRLFEGLTPPARDEHKELRLIHQQGRIRSLARLAVVETPSLSEIGVYSVLDGEEKMGSFAVNFFDAQESRLLNLRPGYHEIAAESNLATILTDNPYTWIIMLMIFIILCAVISDWKILQPKHFG